MRFLLTGIRTNLTLRLKSWQGWAALLLIPLLVLPVHLALPAGEMAAPVQVGVALPEQGAEEFRELLRQRSGTVLTFVFTDEETLIRNVAAGRWDCGLVLPEDFQQRLKNLDLRKLFTIRTAPGSVVYPLVRETVSACVAQLVSPDMAWEYLLDSGIALPGEATPRLRSRLEQKLDASDRVIITMVTPEGAPLEPLELADSGIAGVMYWLVSVLILIRMLLSSADLVRWIHSPGVARLGPVRGKFCLMLTRIGADGLLTAVSAGITMALLGAGAPGIRAAVAYVLFWMCAALLLAHFPRIGGAAPVLLPFAVVISLLADGVVADLSIFAPEAGKLLAWMPVTLFRQGCAGSGGAAAGLLAGGAACLAAAWLLERISKRE